MLTKELRLSEDFIMMPEVIAELVQVACKYESNSYAVAESKRINLKSIMGVMSLATITGNEVLLEIDGKDEEEAMKAMEGFWK